MSTTVNDQKLDRLEKNSNKIKNTRFAIETKNVEVKETENDLIVENIPVQALGQDRDGDKITGQGQEAVVQQLKSCNVPAFPNHGIGDYDAVYDFRDIMGQWIDGEHRDGTTYGDLRLRKGNEAAEHLKDLLEQDMPVGFSVGFIPKDFDQTESQDMEGDAINDLDLMEVSPVGIPSKPEAVNELEDSPVAMAKSIMEENKEKEKDLDAGSVSKQYVERLKNAMTEKDRTKNTNQNVDSKSEEKNVKTVEELVKFTREEKQLSPDEVDTIMEIINLHNEATKEDIRTYMEENNLIEEEEETEDDEEMNSKQFTEEEIQEIMGVVGGIWGQDRRLSLRDGLLGGVDALSEDEHAEEMMGVINSVFDAGIEATREALEDEDEGEEDSAEYDDDKDDDKEVETNGSDQTEDSEKDSESAESENKETEKEQETENGLSEEEKTLSQKQNKSSNDSGNRINVIEEKDKDVETESEEIKDPFKITPDSKA